MNAEDRDYTDYLQDLLDAAQKAMAFCEGMELEEFEKDEKTTFAVVRALEILGEAAKNIPRSIRQLHPDLPWGEMAGMRDKLIHRYFGVDLEIVWATVQERLPEVAEQVRALLEAEAEGSMEPTGP
jgi:uncharacterized protein with HEPN domain